jgi:acylphosphatase
MIELYPSSSYFCILMNNLSLNIIVTGRVQGVGFRFAARNMARSLGVKGFVRNMRNGSVYMEVESEEANMHEFIAWCRRGPAHAQVDAVKTILTEPKGFEIFDIR